MVFEIAPPSVICIAKGSAGGLKSALEAAVDHLASGELAMTKRLASLSIADDPTRGTQAARSGLRRSEGPARNLSLSVIIPVMDEEENVEGTYRSIVEALSSRNAPYEIIFVDDGSSDQTRDRIRQTIARDDSVRLVELVRNFGQTTAIMAGVNSASGDIIVLMDGDGQNDPRDIDSMLEKLDDGFDVVSGWRRDRQDKLITRKIPSQLANRLISWVTGVRLKDYGCTLKAYRAPVLNNIQLYGEMHRFLPAYAAMIGARITEIPVRHFPRKAGKSKYGLERVIKILLDLAVMVFLQRYFVKPIYVFGGFGLLSCGLGFVAGFYALYLKIFEGVSFIETPLPLAVVTCFLMGLISLLMGLLAETLSRTYYESQGKPSYFVRDKVNFPAVELKD